MENLGGWYAMLCKSDCRECINFNPLRLVCKKGNGIMIIPFDLKKFLKERNGIKSVENYNEWDSKTLTWNENSNIIKIRKTKGLFINFKIINDYLKTLNIELELLEWNRDNEGDYVLMKVVK